MQIYRALTPVAAPQGSAEALGYFDGVHCGHRMVLGSAVQYAAQHGLTPAAFTFELPGNQTLKGGRILSLKKLLFSYSQKKMTGDIPATFSCSFQIENRAFGCERQTFPSRKQESVVPSVKRKTVAGPICNNQHRGVPGESGVVLQQVDARL